MSALLRTVPHIAATAPAASPSAAMGAGAGTAYNPGVANNMQPGTGPTPGRQETELELLVSHIECGVPVTGNTSQGHGSSHVISQRNIDAGMQLPPLSREVVDELQEALVTLLRTGSKPFAQRPGDKSGSAAKESPDASTHAALEGENTLGVCTGAGFRYVRTHLYRVMCDVLRSAHNATADIRHTYGRKCLPDFVMAAILVGMQFRPCFSHAAS